MGSGLLNIPDDYIERIAMEAVKELGAQDGDDWNPVKAQIAGAIIKGIKEYQRRAVLTKNEQG